MDVEWDGMYVNLLPTGGLLSMLCRAELLLSYML